VSQPPRKPLFAGQLKALLAQENFIGFGFEFKHSVQQQVIWSSHGDLRIQVTIVRLCHVVVTVTITNIS
jgi:hypothetical protein